MIMTIIIILILIIIILILIIIILILIIIILILIIIMTISFLTSIVSRPGLVSRLGLDVGKLYAAHSEEYSTDGSIEFP